MGKSGAGHDAPSAVALNRGPLKVPLGLAEETWQRRIAAWTWGVVALGVFLRLARYALRFPLWGDETAIAFNFLDRGYLDLLRPLDCHQVAPVLFLWTELTVLKLLGFSEYSLRLLPTVASVVGLLAFRCMAARILRGEALLLAVGTLAVSYYPIRHGAEVKPYAVDLCVSAVLLWLAVEAWRRPDQTRWLWLLALAAPLAVGLSYPSVFVGGAVSAALAVDLWQGRRWRAALAWVVFNATLCGAFLVLLALASTGQHAAAAAVMTNYWQDGFPPLTEPHRLPLWLLATHAGELLAYPVGGERGGSTLTLIAFVAGAIVLVRHRRGWVLFLCLAPFALGLAAAALHRYPYGGHPRLAQYLAPQICLLSGLGAAALAALVRPATVRRRVVSAATAALVLLGLGLCARDVARPYKSADDEEHRAFARRFWQDLPEDAAVVCVEMDLRQPLHPTGNCDRAFGTYRLLRRMYDPRIHQAPRAAAVVAAADRPLVCVVWDRPGLPLDAESLRSWLADMSVRFELLGRDEFVVNAKHPWKQCRYEIYRFAPRRAAPDGELIGPDAPAATDRPLLRPGG
jgi:hypothetical protein